MKPKNYLTTAEFAKLCRTTKDTLFLYDRMNILKPKHVSENSYRYYEPAQFFDFELIMLTKQTGSTLKEIRGYLVKNDITGFLDMFKTRQGRLEEQIEQLMQMKRAMESIITANDEGLAGPFGIPELVDMDEEYLIATPLRQENDTLDNFVNNLFDHYVFCEPIPEVIKHPTGSILLKESFLSGSNQESFLYSRCMTRIESERLIVKPAGRYVRIFLRGKDMEEEDIFKSVRQFIADSALTVCGNVYELDLITYFTEKVDDFVFKYMVHVE